MFTPPNLTIALLMMIASAICWGSWANTYKGVKNYRFELFYWDYAIGIFLISLILAFTMGSSGHDSHSFVNNVQAADTSNIVSTLVGGAIFNLANLLLVAAIDMAGLAVAFPVSIGIALVVGVVLSYALQPRGNAMFLAIGVASALVAVILDGKAYGSLASAGRPVSRKSIVTCVVSGVLMGLWAPFVTRSMTRRCFSHPWRPALMFPVEYLFHEEAARRRARKLQRILQRAAIGTLARLGRRSDLGHGHGFQSGGGKFHRGSDFLCNRTIGACGCGAVGSVGMERICGLRNSRQSLSCADVCFLWAGNSTGRASQRMSTNKCRLKQHPSN